MRSGVVSGILLCALVMGTASLSSIMVCAQEREQSLEVTKGVHVAVPQDWSQSERKYRNATELVSPPVSQQQARGFQARTLISSEHRRSHEEALQRLSEIASEIKTEVQFIEISGWPALERSYMAPLERPGEKELEKPEMALRVTTAIAVENLVIQFQTELTPGADGKLVEQARNFTRNASIEAKARPGQGNEELRRLRELWLKRRPETRVPPPEAGVLEKPSRAPETMGKRSKTAPTVQTGFTRTLQTGVGELEVTASNDGQVLVVAANSGYANSIDGGQTFTPRGGLTVGFPRDDDPSLAFGVSGAFYQSFIGFPNGSAAALGVTGCSTGITRSTDNGVTFPFVNHAVVCPSTGAGICFPDQEHIAADSTNAAVGGDQVYSVWRNFVPAGTATSCNFGSGFVTAALVCSANNGTSWTAPTLMPGISDFPRVTVGPDGFVYVAYRSGGNITLNKFSSCTTGLVQQVGFPVTVSAFTDVVCPVAGLDRCNDGNVLSSPMVAVDDVNANHVYVAFSTNTAAGNENIAVRDSTDGGITFPRVVNTNAGVNGRRFMPWICSLGGTAFVSWYDRRTATAATPDATNYFLGSAFVRGGTLQSGSEENLTVNADRECATGFPCGARSAADFTACSTTGTLGGGCPKYGDYNGNACAGGRIYTAWASATSPPGLPAVTGLTVFASITSRMYFSDAKEPNGSVYEIVGGTAAPIFTFSGALAGNQAYHSAFNRRTNKLYVSNANKFNLYSVDSTTGSASIEYTHTTYLRDVAFDPNGNFYFSESSGAGGDGKIYLLNLTTHAATLFYTVHLAQVGGFWAGDFTFAPDGHLYISTGNQIGAHIYRVDNPALPSAPVSVYSIATESVTGIAFDRSGQFYYSNWDGTNGYIYQLNLTTGVRNPVFSSPGRWISDVSFR
jgi:hypothetical protein